MVGRQLRVGPALKAKHACIRCWSKKKPVERKSVMSPMQALVPPIIITSYNPRREMTCGSIR